MAAQPQIILFDIDGTLIDTGGAGGRAWSLAFKQHFRSECDIGKFTEDGMTDPVIARTLIEKVLSREPKRNEVSELLHAYAALVPDMVHDSTGYIVHEGVVELLTRLTELEITLGITSGNLEP